MYEVKPEDIVHLTEVFLNQKAEIAEKDET